MKEQETYDSYQTATGFVRNFQTKICYGLELTLSGITDWDKFAEHSELKGYTHSAAVSVKVEDETFDFKTTEDFSNTLRSGNTIKQ